MPGFPNESDFTTGGDGDAYWYVRLTDTHRCSTNGFSFITYLQSILGVTQDGRWGPATSAALVSALTAAGADSVIVQGVQGEATLHQIGRVSLTTAIWLIQNYQAMGSVPQNVALNQIELPTNTVLPQWSTAPATPESGMIGGSPTCIVEASSTEASGPTVPAVPTTNAGTDAGGSAPPVPTGLRGLIYQGGSSISWVLIAFLTVGLGVAYWLTNDLVRQSGTRTRLMQRVTVRSRRRRNPRRR